MIKTVTRSPMPIVSTPSIPLSLHQELEDKNKSHNAYSFTYYINVMVLKATFIHIHSTRGATITSLSTSAAEQSQSDKHLS
ncbi:hypothetical protein I308_101166 [Cryptococcus tetragattii IND107]|uniref:Uncharacterized protein n=1 Tax=Cryptococcus tetragattii IND107 TaxID=1296105 RepID=A0ABR3BZI5_9TREE